MEPSKSLTKPINTFLSFTLGTQALYFTVSLLIETGLSTGFSSGNGSHLLLDRLGLLLWVEDSTLLHELIPKIIVKI